MPRTSGGVAFGGDLDWNNTSIDLLGSLEEGGACSILVIDHPLGISGSSIIGSINLNFRQ